MSFFKNATLPGAWRNLRPGTYIYHNHHKILKRFLARPLWCILFVMVKCVPFWPEALFRDNGGFFVFLFNWISEFFTLQIFRDMTR